MVSRAIIKVDQVGNIYVNLITPRCQLLWRYIRALFAHV